MKITMKQAGANLSIKEAFKDFVVAQTAKGVSDKTVETYHVHFRSIGKHLDTSLTFDVLKQTDLDRMVVSMRQSRLAHNSISSYLRVFRTFLNWCAGQGYTALNVPNYKQVETVKETYTDEELLRLLKKPAASCNFCEYRNWVIVNFLLNCGCRAATVRNILIEDVFLADSQIIFRHTKTHKVQAVPLCSQMVNILRAYMKIRGGKQTDYLFCDEYGRMLTENALRLAITHYNHSRGVEKTSIHLFRHTFARKYLVDCGGNAFTLQKLLGHATLKMTKHYCNIYDADIAKSFDRFSPLAQMNVNAERIAKLSARR